LDAFAQALGSAGVTIIYDKNNPLIPGAPSGRAASCQELKNYLSNLTSDSNSLADLAAPVFTCMQNQVADYKSQIDTLKSSPPPQVDDVVRTVSSLSRSTENFTAVSVVNFAYASILDGLRRGTSPMGQTLNFRRDTDQMDSAINEARLAMRWETNIALMDVLFFVFIASTPIVLFFCVANPQGGIKLAASYMTFGIWTQSWIPMLAIVTYWYQTNLDTLILQADRSALTSSFNSLSANNVMELLRHVARISDVAASMMNYAPMITFAIMSGSMFALTTMINTLIRRDAGEKRPDDVLGSLGGSGSGGGGAGKNLPAAAWQRIASMRAAHGETSFDNSIISPNDGLLYPGKISVSDSSEQGKTFSTMQTGSQVTSSTLSRMVSALQKISGQTYGGTEKFGGMERLATDGFGYAATLLAGTSTDQVVKNNWGSGADKTQTNITRLGIGKQAAGAAKNVREKAEEAAKLLPEGDPAREHLQKAAQAAQRAEAAYEKGNIEEGDAAAQESSGLIAKGAGWLIDKASNSPVPILKAGGKIAKAAQLIGSLLSSLYAGYETQGSSSSFTRANTEQSRQVSGKTADNVDQTKRGGYFDSAKTGERDNYGNRGIISNDSMRGITSNDGQTNSAGITNSTGMNAGDNEQIGAKAEFDFEKFLSGWMSAHSNPSRNMAEAHNSVMAPLVQALGEDPDLLKDIESRMKKWEERIKPMGISNPDAIALAAALRSMDDVVRSHGPSSDINKGRLALLAAAGLVDSGPANTMLDRGDYTRNVVENAKEDAFKNAGSLKIPTREDVESLSQTYANQGLNFIGSGKEGVARFAKQYETMANNSKEQAAQLYAQAAARAAGVALTPEQMKAVARYYQDMREGLPLPAAIQKLANTIGDMIEKDKFMSMVTGLSKEALEAITFSGDKKPTPNTPAGLPFSIHTEDSKDTNDGEDKSPPASESPAPEYTAVDGPLPLSRTEDNSPPVASPGPTGPTSGIRPITIRGEQPQGVTGASSAVNAANPMEALTAPPPVAGGPMAQAASPATTGGAGRGANPGGPTTTGSTQGRNNKKAPPPRP